MLHVTVQGQKKI